MNQRRQRGRLTGHPVRGRRLPVKGFALRLACGHELLGLAGCHARRQWQRPLEVAVALAQQGPVDSNNVLVPL